MMTVELITALFYEVEEPMRTIPKHPEAPLWPSEVVTLGLLHALKGGGNRAFYRWLTRAYRPLFPRLPERTRLFRLFTTHHDWTQVFLAAPTVLGGIDTYGIELLQPMRAGRNPQQIGRKGLSNDRWIVGGKLYPSGAGAATDRHGGDTLGAVSRLVSGLWALEQSPGAHRAYHRVWTPLQCPDGGTGRDLRQRAADGADLLCVGTAGAPELGAIQKVLDRVAQAIAPPYTMLARQARQALVNYIDETP